jgi:NAD(P)H-dependent flavin oxidoreductase YrpB (nitropropane dioxygenase family)
MHTPICDRFGIHHPIFGFSPSAQVVAAVTNAGGMGILGVASMTAQGTEDALSFIEAAVNGKPYGVDVIMPHYTAETGAGADAEQLAAELRKQIPAEHVAFVKELLDRFGVPQAADTEAVPAGIFTHLIARSQLEVVFAHRPAFVVNALGPLPADLIARCHEAGIPNGALAGKLTHALRHRDAGVDVIVSTGYEAAGHTGDISGMVLHAEIAAAVADTPVLAAGAMGSGRQIAAAVALGAQGAWCGSAWLTSEEWTGHPPTELFPGWVDAREQYLAATSSDTVRTRWATGKPARLLRTAWSDAWEAPDSPGFLPMPLQGLLVEEAQVRISHANRTDLGFMPAGQVIGMLNEIKPVAQIIACMVCDYDSVVASLPDTLTTAAQA